MCHYLYQRVRDRCRCSGPWYLLNSWIKIEDTSHHWWSLLDTTRFNQPNWRRLQHLPFYCHQSVQGKSHISHICKVKASSAVTQFGEEDFCRIFDFSLRGALLLTETKNNTLNTPHEPLKTLYVPSIVIILLSSVFTPTLENFSDIGRAFVPDRGCSGHSAGRCRLPPGGVPLN